MNKFKLKFKLDLSGELNKKKDEKCAPGISYKNGSCFSLEQLKKMSSKINNSEKKNIIDINDDKKNLLKQLNKYFGNKYRCPDQKCWIATDIIKDLNDVQISQFTFRPDGPSKGYEWLSTLDINKVLKQYENIYSDFISYGAVPSDFELIGMSKDEINDENNRLPMMREKFKFENLYKINKSKFGLVINLDTSGKPGSHWVALYVDLNKGNIFFSDSVGQQPNKYIKNYMNRIANYLIKKNITPNIKINKTRHQNKNSECGVYSINFILRLLKGETFEEISGNKLDDDLVNLCRDIYFT
jgi:hypothetical protein